MCLLPGMTPGYSFTMTRAMSEPDSSMNGMSNQSAVWSKTSRSVIDRGGCGGRGGEPGAGFARSPAHNSMIGRPLASNGPYGIIVPTTTITARGLRAWRIVIRLPLAFRATACTPATRSACVARLS